MTISRRRLINGQMRHVSGWIPDRPDPRDVKLSTSFLSRMTLPHTASLRPLMPRVENQGTIGSCTGNSATTGYEYLYLKTKQQVIQFSRLFNYAMSRKMEGTPLEEDGGAQIRSAIKALAKFGCCQESVWPYIVERYSLTPSAEAIKNAMAFKVVLYYRCPSLAIIKASIVQRFPVVGGFSCPTNMFSQHCSDTGVIKYPEPSEGFEGGHAVIFTGYNDETGLLEFQNSWGVEWGNKGFGYLPYEMVTKGYADDFWTIRLGEGL